MFTDAELKELFPQAPDFGKLSQEQLEACLAKLMHIAHRDGLDFVNAEFEAKWLFAAQVDPTEQTTFGDIFHG